MAIAFRAAGAANSGDAVTSFTLAAPAGTATTDVVLAIFMFAGGNLSSLTSPAGWTLSNRTDDGGNDGMAVYWGLGTATFGDWAPSLTGTICGFTLGYTGVDTVTPMDAAAVGQFNAASTTVTAPSITTVTANTMLVGVFGSYDPIAGTLPSWSLEFGTHRLNTGIRGLVDSTDVDACDAAQAAAGASGAKTATISKSLANIGVLAALRPASGGGGDVLMAQVCI